MLGCEETGIGVSPDSEYCRLLHPKQFTVSIFGHRKSGKSAFVHRVYARNAYFDLHQLPSTHETTLKKYEDTAPMIEHYMCAVPFHGNGLLELHFNFINPYLNTQLYCDMDTASKKTNTNANPKLNTTKVIAHNNTDNNNDNDNEDDNKNNNEPKYDAIAMDINNAGMSEASRARTDHILRADGIIIMYDMYDENALEKSRAIVDEIYELRKYMKSVFLNFNELVVFYPIIFVGCNGDKLNTYNRNCSLLWKEKQHAYKDLPRYTKINVERQIKPFRPKISQTQAIAFAGEYNMDFAIFDAKAYDPTRRVLTKLLATALEFQKFQALTEQQIHKHITIHTHTTNGNRRQHQHGSACVIL